MNQAGGNLTEVRTGKNR